MARRRNEQRNSSDALCQVPEDSGPPVESLSVEVLENFLCWKVTQFCASGAGGRTRRAIRDEFGGFDLEIRAVISRLLREKLIRRDKTTSLYTAGRDYRP